MTEIAPLKSLDNNWNDFWNDLGSKNMPFVPLERLLERQSKTALNLLKTTNNNWNALPGRTLP